MCMYIYIYICMCIYIYIDVHSGSCHGKQRRYASPDSPHIHCELGANWNRPASWGVGVWIPLYDDGESFSASAAVGSTSNWLVVA